jgi:haloacetate dehalogenase
VADIDRRDLIRQVTALAAGSYMAPAFARTVEAAVVQAPASDTLRFFPGFKTFDVKTAGATIHGVVGGSGPPMLLLHGAPQTHVTWRLVAPELAKSYTVIVPDLRGYGDSSKPADGENHANYSKRALALDQVEVMKHFGFDRFPVVGQDRGGRVGHRMALDHPDKVTALAVLDIIPTYYHYTHVTIEFVQAYFHWFNYLRPAPGPENDLKTQADAQLARATSEVQREYLRTSSQPENIHGMCEDYRAGASIDLKHDEADLNKKIACPLLVLWSERGPMGRLFDMMTIWRERGTKVTGKGLPGGHYLQEDVPEQVLTEVRALLKT